MLHRPLVNQPGTRFQYGVGLDWAGVLVERVSGLSLEEYFQQFILRPLGIESISFFPSVEMKMNLAYMHQRDKDGTAKVTDHLYRYPLLPCKPGMEAQRFCMGGAGCFGKPIEYCSMWFSKFPLASIHMYTHVANIYHHRDHRNTSKRRHRSKNRNPAPETRNSKRQERPQSTKLRYLTS